MKKGFTLIDLLIAIAVIAIIIGLCASGCSDSPPSGRTHKPNQQAESGQPKEKFFRGDVVIHKSDQRHGVIVGKRYTTNPGHAGGPHDCWLDSLAKNQTVNFN